MRVVRRLCLPVDEPMMSAAPRSLDAMLPPPTPGLFPMGSSHEMMAGADRHHTHDRRRRARVEHVAWAATPSYTFHIHDLHPAARGRRHYLRRPVPGGTRAPPGLRGP